MLQSLAISSCSCGTIDAVSSNHLVFARKTPTSTSRIFPLACRCSQQSEDGFVSWELQLPLEFDSRCYLEYSQLMCDSTSSSVTTTKPVRPDPSGDTPESSPSQVKMQLQFLVEINRFNAIHGIESPEIESSCRIRSSFMNHDLEEVKMLAMLLNTIHHYKYGERAV